jgi:hypothetical protein
LPWQQEQPQQEQQQQQQQQQQKQQADLVSVEMISSFLLPISLHITTSALRDSSSISSSGKN